MNAHRVHWLLALILSTPLAAFALSEGDGRDAVIDELGDPSGNFSIGSKEILQYDRGQVTLVDGTVTAHSIVSAEEAKRRAEARAQQEKEAREKAAALSAQRLEEGNEKKEAFLANKDFLASSAANRAKVWGDLKKKYPEINVSAPLNEAKSELAAESKAKAEAVAKAQAVADATPPKGLNRKKMRKWQRAQGNKSPGS